MDLGSTWTGEKLDFIKALQVKCRRRADVHLELKLSMSRKAMYLSYPTALLSSAMSPISVIIGSSSTAVYVNVIAYFLIAVAAAAGTTFNFNELSERHHCAYAEYERLFEKISYELLTLNRPTREVCFESRNAYIMLVKTAPTIPSATVDVNV